VITFPPELFAPIGVRTVGVFMKKGIPQRNQKVLWIRALHDGFRLKKGKRLRHSDEKDDLETVKLRLAEYLDNQNTDIENVEQFQKLAPIEYTEEGDYADKELELCPEAYLDEKPVSQKEMNDEIEKLMREAIAVNIKFEKELRGNTKQ
jgi:type I restriction-modification system DNA methylase subunit